MDSFDTFADVLASPGPATAERIYVAEGDAMYRFNVGGVATPNGFTVLGVTGGTAGVYEILSDRISLEPVGGGADDGVRLTLASAACKDKCTLHLRYSTAWTFATPCTLAGSHVTELTDGSILTSTQTPGSFTAFIFVAMIALNNGPALTTVQTAAGDNTLTVNTLFAAGNIIWLGQTAASSTYVAAKYRVESVSGAGPYVLTLDRPLNKTFIVGTRVQLVTTDKNNVVINGNGALLRGPADRHIQLLGVWNAKICRTRHDAGAGIPSTVGYGVALDLGCLNGVVEDVDAEEINCSLVFECGERTHAYRSSSRRCTNVAQMIDSVDSTFNEFTGSDYTSGITIGTNTTAPLETSGGSFNSFIIGGQVTRGTSGVSFGRATQCGAKGVTSSRNTFNFDIGTTQFRTTLTDCISERAVSTGYGFYCHGPGISLANPRSLSDIFAIYVADTCDVVDVSNPEIINYTTRAVSIDTSVSAASQMNIRGGRIASTTVTDCIDIRGGMNVLVDSTRIALAAGVFGVYHRTAASPYVCTLRDVVMTQSGAGSIGYFSQAGGVHLRREGRTNPIVTTPYTINATSYANFGSFTLNGASTVNIAFPDLKLHERLKYNRSAVSGGTGLDPVITATPGTGFAVVSTAGNLDTYQYEI